MPKLTFAAVWPFVLYAAVGVGSLADAARLVRTLHPAAFGPAEERVQSRASLDRWVGHSMTEIEAARGDADAVSVNRYGVIVALRYRNVLAEYNGRVGRYHVTFWGETGRCSQILMDKAN